MKYSLSIVVLAVFFHSTRLSAQSSGTMTSIGQQSSTFIIKNRDTVYQLPKEFVVE